MRTAARVARSLPMRTRKSTGDVHDYGDPWLLHERGLIASLAAAWLDTPAAVAGVDHEHAADLCLGDPPALPTTGASSSLFALAGMAERGATGPLVAVEQAILSSITVSGGTAYIRRREPNPRPMPAGRFIADADIPISLAAYERAFEAKVRWEAGQFTASDELDFPPCYRIAGAVDKGLAKTDLQAAWFGAMGTADGFPSGILADTLGLPDLPVTRIENSCATGHDAIRNALLAVASGAFDVALVMGADKLRDTTSADMLWEWEAMTRDMAWDHPLGLVAPAGFAFHVRRYLHESPATEEHLAMVAVKNRRRGVNNPKARLRFEITMEQALNAPTVVTPFRLYDCAPQSDGAAALVIAAEDVVDRYTDQPVWVRGVGLGLDLVMHQHKPDMTMLPATTRAAKQAFAMAGLTPSDVDVAEVHDFLTGIELMSYEDLGFAERLGGHKLLEAEVNSVGGALPANPSGGLKAIGHPPGATGVAQCVELFQQLRGEAVNQVDGARIALAHNIGGPTAVSAVTILEGSGGLN